MGLMGECVCPTTDGHDVESASTKGDDSTYCYRLNLDAPVSIPIPYDPQSPQEPSNNISMKNSETCHSVTNVKMSNVISTTISNSTSSGTQASKRKSNIFRANSYSSENINKSASWKDELEIIDHSRQEKRIEKAIDIVDEVILGMGKQKVGEQSNIMSVVVIGEYNDFRPLVRDALRKLRDQDDQADNKIYHHNYHKNV